MNEATAEEPSAGEPIGLSLRVASFLEQRSTAVLVATLVITALLALPMLFLATDEVAAQDPGGPVVEAQALAGERFANPLYEIPFIIEADNVVGQQVLVDLAEAADRLRADPEIGRLLSRSPDLPASISGLHTIADAVRDELGTPIQAANPGALSAALDAVIRSEGGPFEWGLAPATSRQVDGRWVAPAMVFTVFADNEALGGGQLVVTVGTDDTTAEQFARDVQAVLRAESPSFQVWALAADVNLTSNDQGLAAGPFIAAAIGVILILVGVAFRSYWAVALSGAALAMLIVWLKGGSALIGLKNDQLLSTIVPISMISFGVDSAFHSLGRYREERASIVRPRRAFVVSLSGVVAALTLAVATDSAAFLANTTSRIPSVAQFGIAAALAAGSAFLLLGLIVPLAFALIEERTGRDRLFTDRPAAEAGSALGAIGLATVTVMMLVFVSPAIGMILLILFVLVALFLPLHQASYAQRDRGGSPGWSDGQDLLGRIVAGLADRSALTLAVAGVVTVLLASLAVRLEVRFDVKDFFAADSDFVVGLDKFADHIGSQGGEPAYFYIEGDLTDPTSLARLRGFVDELATIDEPWMAARPDGTPLLEAGLLDIVDSVMSDPSLRAAVTSRTGVPVTDADSDDLPDSPDQVGAIYETLLASDAPMVGGEPAATRLWQAQGGDRQATLVLLALADTRAQTTIQLARDRLEPLGESLVAQLDEAEVILTGSPVFRDVQLDGIVRSMLVALPVAVLACLVIASLFMRSLRFGIIATIPVVLVVVWLYGTMYIAGFGINVVTAIIGAVSVGIGIDFATHFTMRFLEERQTADDDLGAIEAAGRGTGSALAGSALTSVGGFSVLAFAPMPLFASYGLLTAVMIMLALVASLAVLPALLIVTTANHPITTKTPGPPPPANLPDLATAERPTVVGGQLLGPARSHLGLVVGVGVLNGAEDLQTAIRGAVQAGMEDLERAAQLLGADAVTGVRSELQTVEGSVVALITGDAVTLSPAQANPPRPPPPDATPD